MDTLSGYHLKCVSTSYVDLRSVGCNYNSYSTELKEYSGTLST